MNNKKKPYFFYAIYINITKRFISDQNWKFKKTKDTFCSPKRFNLCAIKNLKAKAIGSLLEIRFQIFCTCFSEAADFLITEITDSISES